MDPGRREVRRGCGRFETAAADAELGAGDGNESEGIAGGTKPPGAGAVGETGRSSFSAIGV